MLTLVTSLALLAGVAQAQEREWELVHELRCTDTQVNMTVVVTPRGDRGPENILYRDGEVKESHCFGGWDLAYPNQPDALRQELEAQCLVDGLDAELCADLSDDIVARMIEISHVAPLDAISVDVVDETPDLGARVVLGVDRGDDESTLRRAFWSDEGKLRTTTRRTDWLATEDTALQCQERRLGFGHGTLTEGMAHVEFQHEVQLICTDPEETLDIDIRMVFKNRAVDA